MGASSFGVLMEFFLQHLASHAAVEPLDGACWSFPGVLGGNISVIYSISAKSLFACIDTEIMCESKVSHRFRSNSGGS